MIVLLCVSKKHAITCYDVTASFDSVSRVETDPPKWDLGLDLATVLAAHISFVTLLYQLILKKSHYRCIIIYCTLRLNKKN